MSRIRSFITTALIFITILLLMGIGEIGTVYGERKWTVYSYPFSDTVFISAYLNKNSKRSIRCDTSLTKEVNYFLAPKDLVIKDRARLVKAIQKKLDQGFYAKNGCR